MQKYFFIEVLWAFIWILHDYWWINKLLCEIFLIFFNWLIKRLLRHNIVLKIIIIVKFQE